MARPADSGFGPEPPADRAGAPFSVTGPPSVSLGSNRHAVASFVVTNISGQPVIARLLPQGVDATEAAWLSLVGDIERPLGVDATLTAEVEVDVPADAPPGQHSMRLDVAVEQAPDRVTIGQSVSFTVPEAPKKRFPMWILAVVVVALVVIGVGAWAILRFTATDDPTPLQPPAVLGTAEIGSELTVQPGVWDPADATLLYRWQACVEGSTGCTDITVTTDGETVPAAGPSFVVGPDQEGARLLVIETAVIGDAASLAGGPDSLGDLPQASQGSPPTDVVPPAPPEQITVPNVIGRSFSGARAALTEAGLQSLWTTVGAGTSCDPIVEAQAPAGGQLVELGGTVAITTKSIPWNQCIGSLGDIPWTTTTLPFIVGLQE